MRRLDHRGIDADHRATRIDQRPARVAGIQRRIRLNHVFDEAARLRPQRSADGADDAGGHGVLEAVRIPDGDRDLADANAARVGERRERQRPSFDADSHDGKIGVCVAADQVGRRRSAVWKHRLQAARTGDHVMVGEDQAVGAQDDAGAAAAVGVDARDRRRNRVDGRRDRAGIRVEQIVVVVAMGQHASIVRSRRRSGITRMGRPTR